MTSGAAQAAENASNHPALRRLARVGHAVNGVLHLLIAALALAVALGTASGQNADQSGALATVADQPAGVVLLAVMAIALAGLAVWLLSEAVFPDSEGETFDRLKHLATAVVYGALCFTAASFVFGSGSSSQSRKSARGFTATLMDQPAGRWLVAAVGVGVVAVGGYFVVKGITRRFEKDLQRDPGRVAMALGTVGYLAKGVAVAVLGVLFVTAAVQHSPRKAAGLDAALRTLKEQPLGPVLLIAVGLGLGAYGGYCLARARHGKM